MPPRNEGSNKDEEAVSEPVQPEDQKEKEVPLTEEDMERLSDEYENEIAMILPAQLVIVYERNKETGEQLPAKLCARNPANGELYAIVKDLERLAESDQFHAAVHVRSMKEAMRQKLMGRPGGFPGGG